MTSSVQRDRAGNLWTALLLYSAAYVPLYLLMESRPFIPVVGRHLSWILTAWGAFLAVLIGLHIADWRASGKRLTGEKTRFGPFVPSRLARRTGIPGTDWFGAFAAAGAAVINLHSMFLFPWLAVVAIVFAYSALRAPNEHWPIHPRRTIPSPPAFPAIDPSEDALERSWTWPCRCRPVDTTVSILVRTNIAERRGAENPSHTGINLADFETVVRHLVEEGSTDREPAEAARQLLAFARANRFNYFEEAQNTLQFVQVIPYLTDADSKGFEYFRYAIETFYDDAGDCDCKAILAATLFRLMGLRSVVLLSADEQHAAVAVEGAPDFPGNRYFEWNGGKFYFCETTDGSFGFTVGEVPPTVDLRRYTVRVEVEPALLAALV